jgi:glycerol kinase
LATGYWRNTDELTKNWGIAKRWTPAMKKEQRGQLYAAWQKAVTRSFGWIE